MWPKVFGATGIAVALSMFVAVPVRAELASGSTLNITSQGVGMAPDRKVTIVLEDSNRLVFRSGQAGRLLPTANQGSQLTLGLGVDRQINILPSSATFETAYADTTTIIQDLPLNHLGAFQGEIPGFIQNIWVKTGGGGREVVSFTLFSVNYNAQTGQGEMTGAFIEADGKEHLANGAFLLDPNDGCTCNYAMQLAVQTVANGGGPPGGGSPAGGGTAVPLGPIGGSTTGGSIGGFLPFLAFAALPFAWGGDSDQSAPAPQASPERPPGTPTPPSNPRPNPDEPPPPVPSPALLPGLMGLIWQTRRRRQIRAALPNGAIVN